MTDESVIKIKIEREIPFFGEGDSLENRLRKVTLRGFPNVKIYEDAKIELIELARDEIQSQLHTPQLRVYRDYLDRIALLAELFKKQGVDILRLDKAYDFVATSGSKVETEWTMLPPVIERFFIPRNGEKLNYADILGREVIAKLKQDNLWLNPELDSLVHTSTSGTYDLINDGAHRIYFGFENEGIRILRISNITPGFPYYAAPQRYEVKVFPTREEALKFPETKIHVVQEPAHKSLYRVFSAGGIKSGDVRTH